MRGDACDAAPRMQLHPLVEEALSILALLIAVAIVYARLPRVDVGHTPAYLRRRFINWFPLGLTYAFLYMGRYNLTAAKGALDALGLMSNADFGTIKSVGAVVYGCSFLLNGPLADKLGGRRTMLIGTAGVVVANVLMGAALLSGAFTKLRVPFTVLYALNMYFQSFGAVSIVKVNASWFHLRERGAFGGIFGILISLGLYLAFDPTRLLLASFPPAFAFFLPAAVLFAFFIVDYLVVRDTPGEAGHADFDVADASSADDGPPLGLAAVAKKMLTHPVILAIALVEFCSGYLRAALMDWYYIFAQQTGAMEREYVPKHWGLMQCVAGILGGVIAGVISDRLFASRRGPVAALLYGVCIVASVGVSLTLLSPALGWVVVLMMLAIIGVHGMLSGTASMDFGGRKNAGLAVGIIDGFVYLGVAAQAFLLGRLLPEKGHGAEDPTRWTAWPWAMMPVAVIGFVIALRLWNARPASKSTAAH
jgi:OPA family glycerol-3-phosphate transporter-like MFS transporter